MKLRKSRRWTRRLTTALAILLLAGGVYLLYNTLNPMIAGQFINPSKNSTTDLLKETEQKISENRVYIPSIDINLPYAAGSAGVMENGAWWRVPDNGNPKDGGNFVLSAHRFIMGLTPEQTLRKSPFYNIDKLKIGDEIVVDYDAQRYTYIIRKIHRVAPTAVEIERRTESPQLTLYSCTLGGAADGREVLVATLKNDEDE